MVGGSPARSRLSRRSKVILSASAAGVIFSCSNRARTKLSTGLRVQLLFFRGSSFGFMGALKAQWSCGFLRSTAGGIRAVSATAAWARPVRTAIKTMAQKAFNCAFTFNSRPTVLMMGFKFHHYGLEKAGRNSEVSAGSDQSPIQSLGPVVQIGGPPPRPNGAKTQEKLMVVRPHIVG